MQSNEGLAQRQSQVRDADGQKIEVSYETSDGATQAVVRQLTWTDGLGWCAQKTLRLDEAQVEDLHRALAVARLRFARERSSREDADYGSQSPAQVIHLPTLA